MKAPTGSFELTTLRDRNGTFEPQLVKKHQTTLSDEIECKIIRQFALGMSYQDISREIEALYAFNVSTATISAVTDKVIPELKQWQCKYPSFSSTYFLRVPVFQPSAGTLVADNYIIHKSRKVERWLEENPKFRLLFLPTYSPWLDPIERL